MESGLDVGLRSISPCGDGSNPTHRAGVFFLGWCMAGLWLWCLISSQKPLMFPAPSISPVHNPNDSWDCQWDLKIVWTLTRWLIPFITALHRSKFTNVALQWVRSIPRIGPVHQLIVAKWRKLFLYVNEAHSDRINQLIWEKYNISLTWI
jgi:hypothetical protein